MDQPRSALDDMAELVRLARRAPGRVAERMAPMPVRAQAALALSLPAHARLELLLHAPQPLRLVRSLPDSELYLTVRELGPADALPIVALASAEQLLHTLDLEAWRRDRFDGPRAGAWVALFLEAGEPALRRLLRATDDDTLALIAQSWMQVRPIEPEGHGHELHVLGQTETGHEQGLVSPDGGYLLSPTIVEHAPVVRRITQLLYREDPERYLRILWSAVWELGSELEERALHWRQSRLEEHGFPPWDEAIGVYAPPARPVAPERPTRPEPAEPGAPPRALLRLAEDGDPWSAAVARMPVALQERALHETLSVANRLLVADGADTGDPEAHRDALRRVAGYVAIALEARGSHAPDAVRDAFHDTPVLELFREGFARAVELQSRARRLVSAGWGSAHPRALELLEPEIALAVRGLLAPRPLAAAAGGEPRPFRSLAELERSRASLESAELVGRVMVERLGLDLARVLRECDAAGAEPPRFSAFMLTLLAWNAARDELRGDPLPADVAADFLRNVASRRTSGPEAPPRAMAALTGRMIRAFGLDAHEGALLRAFGESCLERLASECGSLDPGVPVDPRYVNCLLLRTEGS